MQSRVYQLYCSRREGERGEHAHHEVRAGLLEPAVHASDAVYDSSAPRSGRLHIYNVRDILTFASAVEMSLDANSSECTKAGTNGTSANGPGHHPVAYVRVLFIFRVRFKTQGGLHQRKTWVERFARDEKRARDLDNAMVQTRGSGLMALTRPRIPV